MYSLALVSRVRAVNNRLEFLYTVFNLCCTVFFFFFVPRPDRWSSSHIRICDPVFQIAFESNTTVKCRCVFVRMRLAFGRDSWDDEKNRVIKNMKVIIYTIYWTIVIVSVQVYVVFCVVYLTACLTNQSRMTCKQVSRIWVRQISFKRIPDISYTFKQWQNIWIYFVVLN